MDPENQNQNTNPLPGPDQVSPPNTDMSSEPAAPVPVPGQVISGGADGPQAPQRLLPQNLNTGFPGPTAQPQSAYTPPSPPAPQPDTTFTQGGVTEPMPGGRRSFKPFIIALVAIIILGGGLAIAYFGYYMNPSVILSQSLSRTGKGYDKLMNYADQQSKVNYKGSTASGTYNLKSDSFSTDGNISFKSDGTNSDTNFNIGLSTTRAQLELRSIKPSSGGSTPDLYLKASGIKGLGGLLGSDDIDKTINGLDGKWIAVDHTLIDNLYSAANSGSSSTPTSMPTRAQVMDELQAFGNVNKQYVFTTDKKKSVTTVVKKYGIENVDGHKTYHYKMALNKTNLKAYIDAQKKALNSSQLESWISKNKLEDSVNSFFGNLQTESKNVSSKDNFDMWIDVNKRLVYKVRVPVGDTNPAANYADIGLNYKGGDNYPFFITGKGKDNGSTSTASLVATLNSKTNSLNLKMNVDSTGTDKYTFNANLTYQPTNDVSKISAPSGSESVSQVLDQLGLGDWLDELQIASSPSAQLTAQDSKRETDIQAVQTQLEAFFSNTGYYPSLADMNNSAWLDKNMRSLDVGALRDPSGNARKLAAKPAKGVYSYQVTDSQGKSCEKNDTVCAKYTLTATLSTGSAYSKSNLD